MIDSTADLRTIVTPEGVPLPFRIASPAERAGAMFVDLLIVNGGLLVLWLVALWMGASFLAANAFSLYTLVSFVVRDAYFPWCEIRYGGATPGKRFFHLRVIARDGGPLTAESVIARNLTRDFEVFLPVVALFAPNALLDGLPGWAALLGSLWLLAGGLLPLFNRDRLRLGDLLGGTMVVRVPPARLLDEITTAPAPADATAEAPPAASTGWAFTTEQLDVYGIEELQVLEGILRRGRVGDGETIARAVAKRIQAKIGWPEDETDERAWEFLTAYYRALRGRLEHKVLFGVRQEHKREGKLARPGAPSAGETRPPGAEPAPPADAANEAPDVAAPRADDARPPGV